MHRCWTRRVVETKDSRSGPTAQSPRFPRTPDSNRSPTTVFVGTRVERNPEPVRDRTQIYYRGKESVVLNSPF